MKHITAYWVESLTELICINVGRHLQHYRTVSHWLYQQLSTSIPGRLIEANSPFDFAGTC